MVLLARPRNVPAVTLDDHLRGASREVQRRAPRRPQPKAPRTPRGAPRRPPPRRFKGCHPWLDTPSKRPSAEVCASALAHRSAGSPRPLREVSQNRLNELPHDPSKESPTTLNESPERPLRAFPKQSQRPPEPPLQRPQNRLNELPSHPSKGSQNRLNELPNDLSKRSPRTVSRALNDPSKGLPEPVSPRPRAAPPRGRRRLVSTSPRTILHGAPTHHPNTLRHDRSEGSQLTPRQPLGRT